jgi:hypothetical protein
VKVFCGRGNNQLSSGMLHCVVWQIPTDVLEEFTHSMIKAMSTPHAENLEEQVGQGIGLA